MSFSSYYLINGGYQDADGNPLADGTLKLRLFPPSYATNSADPGIVGAEGTLCIASGQSFDIPLDDDGNVITSPRQYIIPGNLLTSNADGNAGYYYLSVEDENGQLVYGPNTFAINATSGLFAIDLNTLVPGNPTDVIYPVSSEYVTVQLTSVPFGAVVNIFALPEIPDPLMLLFKNGSFQSPQNIDYQTEDNQVFLNFPAVIGDKLTSVVFYNPSFISGMTQQVPSGAINGTNINFGLATTPATGSLLLFQNGSYLTALGSSPDYTASGSGVTLAIAPDTGDDLFAVYFSSLSPYVATLQEIPSGTVNGINVDFTLSHLPITGTLLLFVNGLQLNAGIDYFLSDTGTEAILTVAPASGSYVRAAYQYSS